MVPMPGKMLCRRARGGYCSFLSPEKLLDRITLIRHAGVKNSHSEVKVSVNSGGINCAWSLRKSVNLAIVHIRLTHGIVAFVITILCRHTASQEDKWNEKFHRYPRVKVSDGNMA